MAVPVLRGSTRRKLRIRASPEKHRPPDSQKGVTPDGLFVSRPACGMHSVSIWHLVVRTNTP